MGTCSIGLLASKISTTPRNPATADLTGGKTSELFSNSCSATLSPDHASAPAFFAAAVKLDSLLGGSLLVVAKGKGVGAG